MHLYAVALLHARGGSELRILAKSLALEGEPRHRRHYPGLHLPRLEQLAQACLYKDAMDGAR